jgi:putative ABC transport system ATP-binding protein
MAANTLLGDNLGRKDPTSQRWLLRGVHLQVASGDRCAVVGPSGSGKTLLLRALSLLDRLDEGEIRWNGKTHRGSSVPNYRRQVVYLHQRPALWEGSVEANLRRPFQLQLHRARRFDHSQIMNWLAVLGRAESFLDQPQQELSGGEIQLVGFLRAIQLDPSILLLDEPTASLDLETAMAMEQLIDLWMAADAGPRAFLWVTHDHGQADRVANRILQMKQGELRDG